MMPKIGDKVRLRPHAKAGWRILYMDTYDDIMIVHHVTKVDVTVTSFSDGCMYNNMVINHGNYEVLHKIYVGGE